jgi:hypothetical protein
MMQELANYFMFKNWWLELLKAHYHHTQFSKHVHEGYCIGLIEEGAQSFLDRKAAYCAQRRYYFSEC